jgi:hypothetical protein
MRFVFRVHPFTLRGSDHVWADCREFGSVDLKGAGEFVSGVEGVINLTRLG